MVEVVVALAVVATTLAAIGSVVANTRRNSREMEDRLAANSVAESILNGFTERRTMRPGRTTGEMLDRRWVLDVTPLARSAEAVASTNWAPFAATIQVRAPSGRMTQVTTVRLLPKIVR